MTAASRPCLAALATASSDSPDRSAPVASKPCFLRTSEMASRMGPAGRPFRLTPTFRFAAACAGRAAAPVIRTATRSNETEKTLDGNPMVMSPANVAEIADGIKRPDDLRHLPIPTSPYSDVRQAHLRR